MNAFTNPGELRNFAIHLAGELARAGMSEAAERLQAAANFPATTGSEWLGELGLAVREVRQKNHLTAKVEESLDRIMAAVRVAWPGFS